jgi:hypothetical protein
VRACVKARAARMAASRGAGAGCLARCSHLLLKQNVRLGAHMGEILRFIPKAELERARLVREARATYESIFPPADPANEEPEPEQ